MLRAACKAAGYFVLTPCETAVKQSVGIIKADPGVENVMGFTGGQGATNSGFDVHRAEAARSSAK